MSLPDMPPSEYIIERFEKLIDSISDKTNKKYSPRLIVKYVENFLSTYDDSDMILPVKALQSLCLVYFNDPIEKNVERGSDILSILSGYEFENCYQTTYSCEIKGDRHYNDGDLLNAFEQYTMAAMDADECANLKNLYNMGYPDMINRDEKYVKKFPNVYSLPFKTFDEVHNNADDFMHEVHEVMCELPLILHKTK